MLWKTKRNVSLLANLTWRIIIKSYCYSEEWNQNCWLWVYRFQGLNQEILFWWKVLCYLLQCGWTMENVTTTEKSEFAELPCCKSLKTLQYHEHTTGSLHKWPLKWATKGSVRVNTARAGMWLGRKESKAIQHLPDSRPRTKACVVAGNA